MKYNDFTEPIFLVAGIIVKIISLQIVIDLWDNITDCFVSHDITKYVAGNYDGKICAYTFPQNISWITFFLSNSLFRVDLYFIKIS